jgi:hypothetical protein
VGVGLPLPPLTATVTVKVCAVVILDNDGVTVTLGVCSGAVPMPEMLIDGDMLSKLFATMRAPLMEPALLGVNTTFTVQDASTASGEREMQLSVSLKALDTLTALMAIGPFAWLVTVTLCGVLALPIC